MNDRNVRIKIELVCDDADLDSFVDIINNNAHTGQKSDGKIFVSEIIAASSIRTGKKGIEAL